MPAKSVKIEFTPYRGELEKVTKVITAKVLLHEKSAEFRIAYDYDQAVPSLIPKETIVIKEFVRHHLILAKQHVVGFSRTIWNHELDAEKEKNFYHVLYVVHLGGMLEIYCDKDDTDKIFNHLNQWLNGIDSED